MRLMRAGGRLSLPSTRSRRPPRLRLLDGAYVDAPLRAAAAWMPSGRGCELHVCSASKSPHSTLGVLDGPLLEALSCLREVCVGARRTDRRTAEVTSHVPLDLLK